MEKDEFKELLLQKTKNLDALLEKFLPAEEGLQKTVEEAMNYSVRAGGKRLRPMLMGETFFLCGGKEEDVRLLEPFMAIRWCMTICQPWITICTGGGKRQPGRFTGMPSGCLPGTDF